ncbi:hypothetical protein RR11_792 [Ruegeria sp. R11]|nr:hypothetical protein RR11_792 [Ruegeria sp. R11]
MPGRRRVKGLAAIRAAALAPMSLRRLTQDLGSKAIGKRDSRTGPT